MELRTFWGLLLCLTCASDGEIWPPRPGEDLIALEAEMRRNVSQPNSSLVQMTVILPHETEVEYQAAWKRAGVGILLGLQNASSTLVGDVTFNVTFCDSRCDQSYGPKCLMDAILDGTQVIFGPSCDYSLAAPNKAVASSSSSSWGDRVSFPRK